MQAKKEEITPETLYFSRRKFLKLAGVMGVTAALAACGIKPAPTAVPTPLSILETVSGNSRLNGDTMTPYEIITNYNNFYEFSLSKEDVAEKAQNFVSHPWTVSIEGLVNHPMEISVDELIQQYPLEERIYRMRCVEGWSMVIPWVGFPVHKLLNDLKVKENAKYVRFATQYNHDLFPNQGSFGFAWPYTEGLRLDEANHDLTILAVGLYNKILPPQDGAPIRLVVPWKYGFKSVKSISRIELVEEKPQTFWNEAAFNEYGFYANVNPNVPHPRWSQESERRLGEVDRRPTELFNGYSEVAGLYEGMDLTVDF